MIIVIMNDNVRILFLLLMMWMVLMKHIDEIDDVDDDMSTYDIVIKKYFALLQTDQ